MQLRHLLLGAVALGAVSFLSGVDDKYDEIDQATPTDRMRIICNTPGMACPQLAQGGAHE